MTLNLEPSASITLFLDCTIKCYLDISRKEALFCSVNSFFWMILLLVKCPILLKSETCSDPPPPLFFIFLFEIQLITLKFLEASMK